MGTLRFFDRFCNRKFGNRNPATGNFCLWFSGITYRSFSGNYFAVTMWKQRFHEAERVVFQKSPCRDDVEAGGGEEVAEKRDVIEAETQTGRAEMELGLVVRGDQPQLALNELKTSLFT